MFGRERICDRSSGCAGSPGRAVLLALILACVVALPSTAQSDRAHELFRRFDADSDGRISRMEFELRKVEIIFSRSREEGAQIKFEDTTLSRATFDAIDTNGDGVITASEVTSAPFFAFDNFDTSGDGYIGLEEFIAMLRKIER
jgi:Ca2+-binding EF-hand superfamily protein